MSSVPALSAVGDRVRVHTVTERDLAPYVEAVEASRERLSRWNPVDPQDLSRHLAAQSGQHRTFLVHALDPEGAHGIVGKVNVTNVVRGRFGNGTIGYDAYDPYAGRGLMAQGLRLVVDLAFRAQPEGMGLHRVEANVQPGNVASAGLLRSLGFRREGRVPDMLWLADGSGASAWRDHEAYAVTAQEWPAPPHAPHRPGRVCVVVQGQQDPARASLSRRLAQELSVPLLDDRHAGAAVWSLLAESPIGGVVATAPAAEREPDLDARVQHAGFDPRGVLRVLCGPSPGAAAHDPYGPSEVVTDPEAVTDRDVARLGLAARAVAAGFSGR